ncbi:hypothetical protein AVEN_25098-1 [Araneus ventricosus]|uniref:Uncharacterized protein n=1 Tax=Araneus ventricosus TaxID=182803 RepID=A0A4Y2JDX8_ARAVE|nr:hypothetical protein AVEN_25098-1 [Araneus ventricosus]
MEFRLQCWKAGELSAIEKAVTVVISDLLTVCVCKSEMLADDETNASVIDDQDSRDDEGEHSDNDRDEKGPSSEEAFNCLETALKWLELCFVTWGSRPTGLQFDY